MLPSQAVPASFPLPPFGFGNEAYFDKNAFPSPSFVNIFLVVKRNDLIVVRNYETIMNHFYEIFLLALYTLLAILSLGCNISISYVRFDQNLSISCQSYHRNTKASQKNLSALLTFSYFILLLLTLPNVLVLVIMDLR